MKGNGAVEGKGWLALYLTPKLIKNVCSVLMVVMMGMLIGIMASSMNSASAELDIAIAEGIVPECVKTYATSMFAMLGCTIMLIWWVRRR